jgi:choline dehydrogenase-like flavoprotein
MEKTYDYIIVGGGSAGCVLASRLTEDSGCSVLLLEAGGWDRDPLIHIPLGWPHLFLRRKHDWMFDTEPEASMGQRPIECARGKVIGGSSSVNAMAYVRGHPSDYDRWKAAGLDGWGYRDVLPWFIKQEDWQGPASPLRGRAGPLTVRESTFRDDLVDDFIAAGIAEGFPAVEDYNGERQEGFGRWQLTIRNGRRCSAAIAYLRPALRRPNLTVMTKAHVTRVLVSKAKAHGVSVLVGGRMRTLQAAREVILCAGAIQSPHLLLLSGIGPADALRAHGLDVLHDSPGVGENLQDHISAAVHYARRSSGTLLEKMRVDRLVVELARAWFLGSGVASDLPSGAMAFVRSSEAGEAPDLQFLFNAAPMTAHPYLAPVVRPYADGYACRAVLLRPESRGSITLKSADPQASPRIVQNFLATDKDRRVLREGLRMAARVGAQKPMAKHVDARNAPDWTAMSDGALDAHIAKTGITVHHPAGTCRMGAAGDARAVVDRECRVVGLSGLRVVDASVMPDLVGGNINAAVIMIAEKIGGAIMQPEGSLRQEAHVN